MSKTKPVEVEISDSKKEKMKAILEDLKKRMKEIDKLKAKIEKEKFSFSISPRKSKEILEEIKVPPLEILKNEHRKK